MKIRVLGGGLYGCHIARELLRDGHDVELHEISDHLFAGASGNIPARLHTGAHYPRSMLTRKACQGHFKEFMRNYGDFTRNVPVNIYAIARSDSLLDYGTYKKILHNEVPYLKVGRVQEFGLQNVEGAILIDERHIIVDQLRDFFKEELKSITYFNSPPNGVDSPEWDLTIDATFCSYENNGIDRYEVCLTVLLEGETDRAVTIMDGPFPSLYPWDEDRNICSLTSAFYTPLAKTRTFKEAQWGVEYADKEFLKVQSGLMQRQMMEYYPAAREFKFLDHRVSIRAMPHSAADARLIDIIKIGDRVLRIRAGKMDAIFQAVREIKKWIGSRQDVDLAA